MGMRILSLHPNVNSLKYQEDYEKNKEIRKKTSKFNLPHIMKLGKSIIEKSEIHNTLMKRSNLMSHNSISKSKNESKSKITINKNINFFKNIMLNKKVKNKVKNNSIKEEKNVIINNKFTRNIDFKTNDSKESYHSTNPTTVNDKNHKDYSKNHFLITDYDLDGVKTNSTKEKYSRFINLNINLNFKTIQ